MKTVIIKKQSGAVQVEAPPGVRALVVDMDMKCDMPYVLDDNDAIRRQVEKLGIKKAVAFVPPKDRPYLQLFARICVAAAFIIWIAVLTRMCSGPSETPQPAVHRVQTD